MSDFTSGLGGLSANQINSGMGLGPGGVGDQSQAVYNNLYGPQGFGGQTAQYAAAGAQYGRNVGPQMTDNIYGVSGDAWSRMSQSDRAQFNQQMGGAGANPSGTVTSSPLPDLSQPYGGGGSGWEGGSAGGSVPTASAPGGGGGLATPLWQGTNSGGGGGNIYGVPDNLWGRMSASDRNSFNMQMNQSGASAAGGGMSQAPPYQPPAQQYPAIPGGGGFGAPGFGIQTPGASPNTYTGQPGFGLGIGTMGQPGTGFGGQPMGSTFDPATYGPVNPATGQPFIGYNGY